MWQQQNQPDPHSTSLLYSSIGTNPEPGPGDSEGLLQDLNLMFHPITQVVISKQVEVEAVSM